MLIGWSFVAAVHRVCTMYSIAKIMQYVYCKSTKSMKTHYNINKIFDSDTVQASGQGSLKSHLDTCSNTMHHPTFNVGSQMSKKGAFVHFHLFEGPQQSSFFHICFANMQTNIECGARQKKLYFDPSFICLLSELLDTHSS